MKVLNIDNKKIHFIGCWDLENNNLCKEIIDFFEKNKNLQKQGVAADGKQNLKVKSTIDVVINPSDLKNPKYKIFNNYMEELHKCFLNYQKEWPFLKSMLKKVDIPAFNIQKYSKGDHFAHTHSERSSLNTLHRIFAWMTYLNDVNDGGCTNFSHYDIKIKPETGKTLIWPAEWTHAHSGEVLKSGTKYIITGWMHFPINNN